MTENKSICWKLNPPHVSKFCSVLDDRIEGNLALRSHLEELYMQEAIKKIQEQNNKQVPVIWLHGTYTIVAKFLEGYKSTDDGGLTWRDSTEGEIKAWGYEDD